MKKLILILTLFILGAQYSFAQQQGPNRENRVQALYIAYITNQLKLNESDAQKFWPIYTQYDSELKAVPANLSELERQQALLNVRKKYQDRFSKVLGSDRTNTFFAQDLEFRNQMVNRLRKARTERPNKPMGGKN